MKTTPPIRLYGIFPYDRSAKVRWLLTEMDVPYEDRWIDREKKEYESPEYLRVNPMGRVPAIEIGDIKMFESGAICAYLADLFPERGMAPPLNSSERAEYLKWMFFAASTIDPFLGRIMIVEDIPAGDVRAEKESALLDDYRHVVGVLDQHLAKRRFVVGERLTAADICLGYQLYWTTHWPEYETILRKFTTVLNYLDRLKSMPSAVKAKVFTYPS